MEKKDIYEHLAKIYLDASTKKKKKSAKSKWNRHLVFVSLGLIAILTVSLSGFLLKHKRLNSQISLVLQADVTKINFNFDPAKKEIYSLGLKKLNLARFKTIGLAIKKANYSDKISLKLEFANVFKEQAVVYLKDIPNKWQDYQISLSDFKAISDWSEMTTLALIVEEWNTTEKQGIIYIDNIRLLR